MHPITIHHFSFNLPIEQHTGVLGRKYTLNTEELALPHQDLLTHEVQEHILTSTPSLIYPSDI